MVPALKTCQNAKWISYTLASLKFESRECRLQNMTQDHFLWNPLSGLLCFQNIKDFIITTTASPR